MTLEQATFRATTVALGSALSAPTTTGSTLMALVSFAVALSSAVVLLVVSW